MATFNKVDAFVENLAEMMSWSRPVVPKAGDPVPYEGTAAVPA